MRGGKTSILFIENQRLWCLSNFQRKKAWINYKLFHTVPFFFEREKSKKEEREKRNKRNKRKRQTCRQIGTQKQIENEQIEKRTKDNPIIKRTFLKCETYKFSKFFSSTLTDRSFCS